MNLEISVGGRDVSTILSSIKIQKAINGQMSQASFTLPITQPAMPDVALIQQATKDGIGVTSINPVLGSLPTAGNALILTVAVYPPSSTVTSVTGGGVTWTKIKSTNTNIRLEVWAGSQTDGSSASVTVSISPSSNAFCTLSEWSGVDTIEVDSSSASADTTQPNTQAITTTVPSLIVASTASISSGTFSSGATNGFTDLSTPNGNVLQSAYLIAPVPDSYSTGWTWTLDGPFDAAIVALKLTLLTPVNQSEVLITNTADSSKVFRGIVTQTVIDQKNGFLQWWNVSCTGNEYLLENTIISHSWTGQTDRQIIQSAFGLVLPVIATTDATVAELSVAIDFEAKDITLIELLQQLSAISGADWRITEDLELDYHASGSIVAPFGFSDRPNV